MLKALKFVWKNNRIWLLISSLVLIVVFSATMVATQNVFLRNTINTVMGGERRMLASGDPSQYTRFIPDGDGFLEFESELDLTDNYDSKSGKYDNVAKDAILNEALKLNEKIAEEGIVLLKNKNDKALPLETSATNKTKVSVFGKNSVNLVVGGSGSGAGNITDLKTIYDSLGAADYDINPTLKGFYENSGQSGFGREKEPGMGTTPAGIPTGETPQSSYSDSIKASYNQYNAAALVVISRMGGEGFDLPRSSGTSFTASGVTGVTAGRESNTEHYLQLDKNERDLLAAVCSAGFDKVILIVNSSTSMELGFLDDGSFNIDGALWIGSPGGNGIMALGRVLNGTVNPSGRLVDTYARDFKLNPTWANFSNNNIADGNRYTFGGSLSNAYYVEYEEGIYMGYRYYETRGWDEEFTYQNPEWYEANVVFPFGFGLSYTKFEWDIVDVSPADNAYLTAGGEISVTVRVTNKGDKPGKDVVQLYYNAPYWSGEIEKSHVVLGAYEKTPIILPGDANAKKVTLTLKISDMASYDWNDANNNGFKGYELDDGVYNIFLGKNANHAWQESEHSLKYFIPRVDGAGFKYETDTTTQNAVENRFDNVSNHIESYMSRSGFDSSLPKAPTAAEKAVDKAFIDSLTYTVDDKLEDPWYSDKTFIQGWKPGEGETAYKLYDLIKWNKDTGEVSVDYNDDDKWDNILNQLTISEMAYLIGTGNFNTDYITSIDKPKTTDADGPAGFTNFMGDPTVYDTCFYVSECVVGATWNKNLAYDMGVMVGIEGIVGNVKGDGRTYSGWYAPAVNIHRSPFSGRNFEYYSEDPYLSGMMGANVVKGAKSKGVYTYVKHFAVNDQETDRVAGFGLITWLNEQTMREIYLKPFEIIVKAGKTTAMMSSFNRIGTVWAGGSYELLTEVLREEWGFKGMVISDYNLYDYMPADQMIRAGGDLNLTQNRQPTTTQAALTNTQISAIRNATKNVLYTVAGSNAMNGMGDGVVWLYAMPLWIVWLIVLNCVLFVGFAVWGFLAIHKTIKKSKLQ